MTHADLVQRAVQWLRTTQGCGVVLAEYRCSHAYEPDAIGWRRGGLDCVVVECKVSRADFRADRKKMIHLNPDSGPGHFRTYLTPPGLVRAEEVPDGWGLAEVHGARVRIIVKAPRCPAESNVRRNHEASAYLYSFARRTALGVPFHAPTGRFYETPPAADAPDPGQVSILDLLEAP